CEIDIQSEHHCLVRGGDVDMISVSYRAFFSLPLLLVLASPVLGQVVTKSWWDAMVRRLSAQLVSPGSLGELYEQPTLVVDPGMHTGPIMSVGVDAGGRTAVTGSYDKTMRVWSLADGKLLKTIRMPSGPGDIGKIYAVAMSPNGGLVACGGWTG